MMELYPNGVKGAYIVYFGEDHPISVHAPETFDQMLLLLLSLTAFAESTTKVAIIDSGLDLTDVRFSEVLCKKGHKDFTGTGLEDNHGHGTHIAGIIKHHTNNKNFCLMILKYIDNDSSRRTIDREVQAIDHAIKNGATIINISGGGYTFSEDEYLIVQANPKVKFVVAAGNDALNIDKSFQHFYPAFLSLTLRNVISVGNGLNQEIHSDTSNYGTTVKAWEYGVDVVSTLPDYAYGLMSGTSQSTALHTARILNETK